MCAYVYIHTSMYVPQSCLTLCDPCQAPLCMESSRQESWSGLLLPPPEDLPDPGDQTQVSCIAGRFFTVCRPVLCKELTVFTPIGQMRKLRLREVRWLSWGWSQHVNPKPGPWTSGCPNSQWEGLQVIFLCTLSTCRGLFLVFFAYVLGPP